MLEEKTAMNVGDVQELTIAEFFELVASEGGTYEVETPQGWVELGRLKTETKECCTITTNDFDLGGGTDHLVETPGGWISLDNIKIGDTVNTINGNDVVTSKEYIGKELTYDFEVLHDEHKYYANGIVSHNCGKTMLAKAAASSLAKLHGKHSVNSGFIYVKGPEILRKYVGESEALIRGLFDRARKHKAKHGYPAFMFIDEADAILRKRGTGISSDVENTIVPAFLAEMDGLAESDCIVGLATNRPDTLENAITRDGRIDRKIMVPRPDYATAKDIFRLHLKGIPLVDISPVEAAKLATEELFSENLKLYIFQMQNGKEQFFTLAKLVNGAMIAGVVDQASSIAMHRNIKGLRQKGVTAKDFTEAVDRVYRENIDLNHRDELAEYVDPIKSEVENVVKFRPAIA